MTQRVRYKVVHFVRMNVPWTSEALYVPSSGADYNRLGAFNKKHYLITFAFTAKQWPKAKRWYAVNARLKFVIV